MLAQTVDFCLLVIAQIADADGRMAKRKVECQQLTEGGSRDRCRDNEVVVVVSTGDDLVIALSVIG